MFRPMRRFKQQLPEEQCLEILKTESRGVLSLLGDDGYPYGVPIDYFYEDGKLYFHGAAEGHKVDAMKNCSKASFCVTGPGEKEEGDWALWFNSVIVFGKIRILEDRAEILKQVRKLGEKYYPTQEEVEEVMQRSGGRVACFELTIEHMTGKRVHEK